MKEYISKKIETVIINGKEYNVNLFVKGDEEHITPCDCCCFSHEPSCMSNCSGLGYSPAFSEAIYLTKVNN